MVPFSESVRDYVRAQPDAAGRLAALERFGALGLPTASEEVWRYAPLDAFDLERYVLATAAPTTLATSLADALASVAATTIRLGDGFVLDGGRPVPGVDVSWLPAPVGPDLDFYASDAFSLLNAAVTPGVTTITVRSGVEVLGPLVIACAAGATASFPRVHVVVEPGARAVVIEAYEGGHESLVDMVGEYDIGAGAALTLVAYQRLDHSAWHIARTTARLDRDARLNHAVVGLGARYDRSRNDAVMLGSGAENVLRTTFFGSGDQVHDFRTRQYHVAARTRSTLLSKGAVADEARSVYTGLIEIEHGARRTDARQTNHNLLLSPQAHADSVPNLEIRENDVVCAHASSVGPLDEIQRWYLESRGVPRREAQRLMIRGFFLEMLDALPPAVAELLTRDVDAALGALEVAG